MLPPHPIAFPPNKRPEPAPLPRPRKYASRWRRYRVALLPPSSPSPWCRLMAMATTCPGRMTPPGRTAWTNGSWSPSFCRSPLFPSTSDIIAVGCCVSAGRTRNSCGPFDVTSAERRLYSTVTRAPRSTRPGTTLAPSSPAPTAAMERRGPGDHLAGAPVTSDEEQAQWWRGYAASPPASHAEARGFCLTASRPHSALRAGQVVKQS